MVRDRPAIPAPFVITDIGAHAGSSPAPIRISVVGCGYLGTVHAAALVAMGHDVIGIDVDADRIAALASGAPPFFEPGLAAILSSGIASGRLRFSSDIADAAGATVHFLAVGTPQQEVGDAADLRFVDAAVDGLIPHLRVGDLVVGKSTVPVGTAQAIADRLRRAGDAATLVWNPEFLREGFAVSDTLAPDRLVYGIPDGEAGRRAVTILDRVYRSIRATDCPVVVTNYPTAELVKVAANAFLATKISFINAMAEIADATGGDVTTLADAIGHDDRIGRRFLNAGVGFGGGCLPKDIRAFTARAEELGTGESLAFLREVDAINQRRRARAADLVVDSLGGSATGRRVAVLGLAFKPDSDDVRDSPALGIADLLTALGAVVIATDPKAIENARRRRPELRYEQTVAAAVRDAEVVLLVTEWAEYRSLDPETLGAITAARTIVDGRNVLDPVAWRAAGWRYRGLGRN